MAERWARNGAVLIAGGGFAALGITLVARVPALSPRWTDFNEADPGITLVQLLLFLLLPMVFAAEAAAIHEWSSFSAKLAMRVSLAFATMFATAGAIVPVVELNAWKAGAAPLPEPWPTLSGALLLLAWHFLLGLSLLFAAPAFPGGGLARMVRISLAAAGLLCLAGLGGPGGALAGMPRLERMTAIVPLLALAGAGLLLSIFFAREARRR
jgi:hypothetical protein